MKQSILRGLLQSACFLFAVFPVRAAFPIHEPFDYPAGALNGRNGGTNWSVATQWFAVPTGNLVAAPGMFYDDGTSMLSVSGNALSFVGSGNYNYRSSNFTPLGTPGSRAYISFIARVTSGDSAGVELNSSNFELFMGKSSGQTNWGVRRLQGGASAQSSVPATNTAFLVYRIDFGAVNATNRLYVNPPLSAEPLVSDIGDFVTTTFPVNWVYLRSGSGSLNALMDELRIGTNWAEVTPIGGPSLPILTISNVTQKEGDSGTTNFVFNVTLSRTNDQQVTVNYATTNGTALAGSDYVATNGVLTFDPGETNKTITVQVNGDLAFEPDKNFVVILTSPVNTFIASSQAVGTIDDDDFAQAGLLVHEPFAYAAGNLAGQNGGTGWTNAWSGSGQSVVLNSLFYDDGVLEVVATSNACSMSGTAGNFRNLQYLFGDAGQTIYMSFVGQVDANFYAGLSLYQDNTEHYFIGRTSTSTNWGCGRPNGQNTITSIIPAANLSLLVLRLDYTNANVVIRLYVNPTLSAEPVSPIGEVTTTAFLFNRLRIQSGITTGSKLVDEIRLGTTWVSVVPTIPLPFKVGIGNATLMEGNSGTTNLVFQLTMNKTNIEVVTVDYATTNGTATAGSDYIATNGTVTFNPGETNQTVAVTVLNETDVEFDEAFSVVLSNPVNAQLRPGAGSGTGTILDDDYVPPPLIAYEPFAYTAGLNLAGLNGGTGWSNAWIGSFGGATIITPGLMHIDGTSTLAASGNAVGLVTSFPISVIRAIQDLGRVKFGTIYVSFIGEIRSGNTVTLGLIESGVARVLVGRLPSSFNWSLYTAESGDILESSVSADTRSLMVVRLDYAPDGTTVRFYVNPTLASEPAAPTGETNVALFRFDTLNLGTGGSAVASFDEIRVASTWADAVPPGPPPPPDIAVSDAAVYESNSGTNLQFNVTLSFAYPSNVMVNFATSNGTAVAVSDYVATNGVLTFTPGQTNKTVVVQVIGDAVAETNETFSLILSDAVNGIIIDGVGTGRILDEDTTPRLVIGPGRVMEGDGNFTNALFRVRLSRVYSGTVSVDYTTTNGTALAGVDYAATSGTVTFAPGETRKFVAVAVFGDTQPELNETFAVRLSNPVNATLVNTNGPGLIGDDDTPVPAVTNLTLLSDGDPVPGEPDRVFKQFIGAPVINEFNEMAFVASTMDTNSANVETNLYLWLGPTNELRKIAGTTMQPPGYPPGSTYSGEFEFLNLDDEGNLTYLAGINAAPSLGPGLASIGAADILFGGYICARDEVLAAARLNYELLLTDQSGTVEEVTVESLHGSTGDASERPVHVDGDNICYGFGCDDPDNDCLAQWDGLFDQHNLALRNDEPDPCGGDGIVTSCAFRDVWRNGSFCSQYETDSGTETDETLALCDIQRQWTRLISLNDEVDGEICQGIGNAAFTEDGDVVAVADTLKTTPPPAFRGSVIECDAGTGEGNIMYSAADNQFVVPDLCSESGGQVLLTESSPAGNVVKLLNAEGQPGRVDRVIGVGDFLPVGASSLEVTNIRSVKLHGDSDDSSGFAAVEVVLETGEEAMFYYFPQTGGTEVRLFAAPSDASLAISVKNYFERGGADSSNSRNLAFTANSTVTSDSYLGLQFTDSFTTDFEPLLLSIREEDDVTLLTIMVPSGQEKEVLIESNTDLNDADGWEPYLFVLPNDRMVVVPVDTSAAPQEFFRALILDLEPDDAIGPNGGIADFSADTIPSVVDFPAATQVQENQKDDAFGDGVVGNLGVIANTGEYLYSTTLLSVPGRGQIHFELTLTHRSGLNFDGPPGFNWVSPLLTDAIQEQGNGNVLRANGNGHLDLWTSQGGGDFLAPKGSFGTLLKEPNGTFVLRFPDGLKNYYRADGRLYARQDRFGNRMFWIYGADGMLSKVVDVFGREYQFFFQTGAGGKKRLASVVDFAGREVQLTHDGNGDLTAIRTPIVTGTSTGNNFPNGRTTEFAYSSGFGNPALNHNLVSIKFPEEVANSGPPAIQIQYGTNPGDPLTFDKVISKTTGGVNASGVAAGGTATWTYTEVNTSEPPGNPLLPRKEILFCARQDLPPRLLLRCNEYGDSIEERHLTIGLRPGEPAYYSTAKQFTADGLLAQITVPEGRRSVLTYGSGARAAQANIVQIVVDPDGAGSAENQVWTMTHEPLFNQIASVTDPRGNSGTFLPPVGTASPDRYTVKFTHDYQENPLPVAEAVKFNIDVSGIPRGQGDLNGDGRVDQAMGNGIQTVRTFVVPHILEAGSPAVGANVQFTFDTQVFVTYSQFNDHGQKTAEVDSEGNLAVFLFNAANDPDGDQQLVPPSVFIPGDQHGGYLKSVTRDAGQTPQRTATAAPAQLLQQYRFNPVGVMTSTTDPRGVRTDLEVNALNEVVKITQGADVSQAVADGQLITGETALGLEARNYSDYNGRIVHVEVENRDLTTPGVGPFIDTFNTYDILGGVVAVEEETGSSRTNRFRYDPEGLLTQILKAGGNEDRVEYDERNLPLRITRGFGSPDVATTQRDYDGNGNLIRVTDAEDNDGNSQPEQTLFTYDGFDRLITATDALGNQTLNTYDISSAQIRRQVMGHPPGLPAGGNVLLSDLFFRRDEANRVFRTDEALFLATGFSPLRTPSLLDYDSDGFVTKIYAHDSLNRLTHFVDDARELTKTIYDGAGRQVQKLDAFGNSTTTSFDKNGNAIQVTRTELSPEGLVPSQQFVTRYVYDQLDRLVRAADNAGQATRFGYDSRNNLILRSDPVGALTSDPLGLFPGQINQPGNTRTWVYDGVDRLISDQTDLRVGGVGGGMIDTSNPNNPDGRITLLYQYDKNGRLTRLTDDNGNQTQFLHDDLDRRIRQTNADGEQFNYAYDRDGNLLQVTDPNGSVIARTHDALNRVTQINVTRGAGVVGTTQQTYEYDGLSRLTQATDDNGNALTNLQTCVRIYDSLSRLLEEQQNGQAISSILSGDGNRTQVTYPGGRILTATHDAIDRLKTLSDAGGTIATSFWIGPGARELKRVLGNDTSLSFLNDPGNADIGYDAAQRMVRMRHLFSGGAAFVDREYGYNRAGQRAFERRLEDFSLTDQYNFDSAYRVVLSLFDQAGLPGATPRDLMANAFTLDGAGNRRDQQTTTGSGTTGTAFAVNNVNEYTLIGAAAQVHDDNGNLTDDGARQFFFDAFNRMAGLAVKADGAPIGGYLYHADGRRGRKIAFNPANSGEVIRDTLLFWDGLQCVEEQNGVSGLTETTFVWNWTLPDQFLQFARTFDHALGAGTFFAHQNARGDVVALTDAFGFLAEQRFFDDFGNAFDATKQPVLGGALGNPFGFQCGWFDSESGFYCFGNRYFESPTGRFIQRDWVWDPVNVGNLYVFPAVNPVSDAVAAGPAPAVATGSDPRGKVWMSSGARVQIGDLPMDYVTKVDGLKWRSSGSTDDGVVRSVTLPVPDKDRGAGNPGSFRFVTGDSGGQASGPVSVVPEAGPAAQPAPRPVLPGSTARSGYVEPKVITPQMRDIRQQVYRGAVAAGLNILGRDVMEVNPEFNSYQFWIWLGADGSPLLRSSDAKRLGGPAPTQGLRISVLSETIGERTFYSATAFTVDVTNGRILAVGDSSIPVEGLTPGSVLPYSDAVRVGNSYEATNREDAARGAIVNLRQRGGNISSSQAAAAVAAGALQ